jgi:GNAT superfamily N-acetyltransferase
MYEDSDFEDTWLLFHALARYYRKWAYQRSEDETREYVRERVLGDDSDIRMALSLLNDKVVGLATFSIMYPSPHSAAQLYIKELYVDEKFRGQGAGRAMMKFLARYALDHGCSRLDWSAETDNPGAVEFYTAIGAKPVEEKVYFRFENDDLESFAKGKKSTAP